ncbi:MAG: cell division regulator GpsB [Bacilli bacterium]|jgi:DivIVA domain-containing protein|nr:cell division regulator GpsB [Bacilli bacterium]
MYNEKIYLTPQDILNKEFKKDTMGYRPQEVDKYLDMVIRDYTEFINIIKRLQTENAQLREDREKLRVDNIKMKNIIDSANSSTSSGGSSINYNNVDLLKRISNLEKTVYGKDE